MRMERRIDMDVVDSLRIAFESVAGDFYIVFNMDALFRGDMLSRYQAYAQSLSWQTRDEIRSTEGKNPIGGAASELLVPVNLETVSQAETRSFSKHGVDDSGEEDESDQQQDQQELGGNPETPQDGTNEDTEEEENARTQKSRLRRDGAERGQTDGATRRRHRCAGSQQLLHLRGGARLESGCTPSSRRSSRSRC